MSLVVSISKWGNSQGLRIPKEIINKLQMSVGDKVKVYIEDNRVVIEPIKKRKVYNIDELVANIPKDYKKEAELISKPMGREIW